MKLFWTFDDWGGCWPSRGSDEMFRHTIVIPWPFAMGVDEDDNEPLYHAICFVVAPWWFCPLARRSAGRKFVRWERMMNTLLNELPEEQSQEEFNVMYDVAYDICEHLLGPRPDTDEAFGLL